MSKLDLKQKIVVFFFLSLPFIDLITSLTTRFGDSPVTIGIVIKGVSLVAALVYVFFYSRCHYRKQTIAYLFCLLAFIGIYFLTKPDVWTLSNLFNQFTFLFKYFYFPVMTVCLYHVFHDFKIDASIIKNVICVNAFVFSIMILIPYLTGSGFYTYLVPGRGTYGWFYASNEVGAILAILSICVLDLMDARKKWKLVVAGTIIFATSLIGTKVSFLGLIVSVLTAIIVFIRKHKMKQLLLPAIILGILIVCCLNSPGLRNISRLSTLIGNIPASNVLLASNAEIPSSELDEPPQTTEELIANNKVLRIIDRILSKRLYLLIENGTPYINGDWNTKLFGLGFAPRPIIDYQPARQFAEIDSFDVILHLGIVGFLLYFVPFIFLIKKWMHNRKQMPIESYAYLLAALLGIGISFVAGHVIVAPAVSIYITLLILLVIQQTENNNGAV